MKLILHIGSPKTGTTTLQKCLHDNTGLLEKNGILYPRLEGVINHNELSLFFRNSPPTRQYMQNERSTIAEYQARAKKILNQIKKKSDYHKPNTVILSAEYFFFPLESASANDLVGSIKSLFQEIKVVAYVRDPVDYYVSTCLQVLKASQFIPQPYTPQYRKILQSYTENFDLDVIKFDTKSLYHGDIVKDFIFRYIDVNAREFSFSKRNESISGESMSLISEYRDFFYRDKVNVFNKETNQLHSKLQAIEKNNGLYSKAKIKTCCRNYINSSFKDDNSFLLNNYGFSFDLCSEGRSSLDEENTSFKGKKDNLRIEDVFEIDENKKNSIFMHYLKSTL